MLSADEAAAATNIEATIQGFKGSLRDMTAAHAANGTARARADVGHTAVNMNAIGVATLSVTRLAAVVLIRFSSEFDWSLDGLRGSVLERMQLKKREQLPSGAFDFELFHAMLE